jgi:hypothetical protein
MTEPTTHIAIDEFASLCAGAPVKVQRAIASWEAPHDSQRALVKQKAPPGMGGSSISMAKADVLLMFQTGVIAIDDEKLKLTHYKAKYDKLLADHGLTADDLKARAA